MKVMKVGLIPAAGEARRLAIHTAKELLPIGGRPIIDYCVTQIAAQDVQRIVVVIRAGKESIIDHLIKAFPNVHFDVVYQAGTIGKLIDAIKAAAPRIEGARVYFAMADTIMRPNPFTPAVQGDLVLLCHRTQLDDWRHFGIIDETRRRVVDKPSRFVGNLAWGAMVWEPTFTALIEHCDDLTAAINLADWHAHHTIDQYLDIGVSREQAIAHLDPEGVALLDRWSS